MINKMSLRELAKNLDVPIKLINKLEKGGRLGRYLDALEKRLNKQGYEDYMEEEMSIRRDLEKPMYKGGLAKKKYVNPVKIVDNRKNK